MTLHAAVVLVVSLFAVSSASAVDYYVNNGGSNASNGLSIVNPVAPHDRPVAAVGDIDAVLVD